MTAIACLTLCIIAQLALVAAFIGVASDETENAGAQTSRTTAVTSATKTIREPNSSTSLTGARQRANTTRGRHHCTYETANIPLTAGMYA